MNRLDVRRPLERRVDETRWCPCGQPYVGRGGLRECLGGHPEPRRMLRVRDVDGAVAWRVIPDALTRGGQR